MNKKRIRAVLLAVILTAGCCLIPSSASLKAEETPRPAESVSRYRANDSLNSLRNALGLRTLAMDTALGSAAQAHTWVRDRGTGGSSVSPSCRIL